MRILFDFDGTLADSFDEVAKIVEEMARTMRKQIDPQEVRDIGIRVYARSLGLPVWTLPFLVHKVIRRLRTAELGLFPDTAGMLAELAQHHTLGIVSSNSKENIERTLMRAGVREHFTFIHAGSSLFGKARVLRKLCKKHGIDPSQVIYVGDEDRDISAAREAGMRVVAVSWGYNTRRRLEELQPDALVDSPAELPAVIQKLIS